MILTIKERIVLPSILPAQGNFTTLVIKRDLLEKIKIKQEEMSEYEIEQTGDTIKWDPDKDRGVEIELTELETNLVKEQLKRQDERKELTDDTFELFNKFNN